MKEFALNCEEITNLILSEKNSIVDGVINIEKYYNVHNKILWILKEPNSGDMGWRYQEYLSIKEIERKIGSKYDTLKYRMFKKVLYASYGLLSNVEYSNIPDINDQVVYRVGEQIAYINIKKTGGDSVSKYWEIEASYNKNESILLKQISTYKPNIIIFGNTLCFFDKQKLKEVGWNLLECKTETTKNTTSYFVSYDKLCIHAYHPAYWRISNKDYCSEIINAHIRLNE